MNKLYKFEWNLGRMGTIDGLFIANSKEINIIIGKNIHFGEVLGKHSDIGGELEKEDFEIVSEDQELLNKLESIFGTKNLCGYNPLDYI